ncbi:hypothetical protein EDC96DRAFT_547128 [Choanephora cucurbitarum]|nr:hypothetical protein EDC96DRAFT_547128 [Choanephora cucurbitarum]
MIHSDMSDDNFSPGSDAVVDFDVDDDLVLKTNLPVEDIPPSADDVELSSTLDEIRSVLDLDDFIDAQEYVDTDIQAPADSNPDVLSPSLSAVSSEADYNFDVDIDEIDKAPSDAISTTPSSVPNLAPSTTSTTSRSLHVQRRTSSQEGDNVADVSNLKRRQPIEVEYNLPQQYNPNKRRFKPQILNKRKKKMRLNLLRIRQVPVTELKTPFRISKTGSIGER